ncbi:MAG: TetR/AcrR family transcriptional regulator [Actinomycetota bacterium]
MTEVGEQRIDGRTARRERGKNAVIDAAFRILASGRPATTEVLAREAGISTSSLFRYFDGLDDLFRQAAARFYIEHVELFEASPAPGADRSERIAQFVDLRLRAVTALSMWVKRAEAAVLDHPELGTVLDELRLRTAAQVSTFFGPELEHLPPAKRADVVATIDASNSVIAGRVMIEVHGRSEAQIRRSWRWAIGTLLDDLD